MRKVTGQRMTMKVTSEKILICLVICVFLASCIYSFPAIGSPVTGVEATEISKRSELVEEGLSRYGYSHATAEYYNSSMVEFLKTIHPKIYAKVPEGHGTWDVTWVFWVSEGTCVGYNVIVVVDAETGTIACDLVGGGYG